MILNAYTWQSPFGEGLIDSKAILDLAITRQVKSPSSMVKVGGTNLLNNEYRTEYGGPEVGSIYSVTWTYNQFFGKIE